MVVISQDHQVELTACSVLKEHIPDLISIFTTCPMKFKRYIIMREKTSLNRRHVASCSALHKTKELHSLLCCLSATNPKNVFRISKLSRLPHLLWLKRFFGLNFSSDVVPFQSKEVGHFLAHGWQYRRMGLVYFVTSSQRFIHARNKDEQREIAFFFTECLILVFFFFTIAAES